MCVKLSIRISLTEAQGKEGNWQPSGFRVPTPTGEGGGVGMGTWVGGRGRRLRTIQAPPPATRKLSLPCTARAAANRRSFNSQSNTV